MVEKRVAKGRIQFALHSQNPEDRDDKEVDAAVFASKLGTLVKALKAADKAANNGRQSHSYAIAKLHTSTPTAVLLERPLRDLDPGSSGIDGFNDCIAAITSGAAERALRHGSCARNIALLCAGAERNFGYAEVATSNDVLRIDHYLAERVRAVISPKRATREEGASLDWFMGVAHGSFVGTVQVADLRGKLPGIKLILSPGGQALDCICTDVGVEQIRSALNHRVSITGRAYYDGKSGLPTRVEVRTIEQMAAPDGFERRAGAFRPFSPPEWEVGWRGL
jgi:hypothetical protein